MASAKQSILLLFCIQSFEVHSHRGLASSHFFLRFLHVIQPVLDRPLVTLFVVATGVSGCFRGRPLGRLILGCAGVGALVLATGVRGASLTSSMRISSSSSGSILGTVSTSSESWSQWMSLSKLPPVTSSGST